MAGTGLPTSNSRPVLAQAPGIVRPDLTTAQTWAQLAQTAGQVGDMVADLAIREQRQEMARYLADREIDARRTRAELQAQHAEDPEAFDAAWRGYTDGILSEAVPEAVPALRTALATEGTAGYSAALNRRRERDQALAKQSLDARLAMAGDDVLNLAMAGEVGTPGFAVARETYAGVLNTMKESGFLSDDDVLLRMEELDGRATAEVVLRNVGQTYRSRGADAALATIRDDLLAAGLPPDVARAYESKAEDDIRGWESERKTRLAEAKMAAADVQTAIASGAVVPPEVVETATEDLLAAGGYREAAKLRAVAARSETLREWARLPLPELEQRVLQATASLTGAAPVEDRIVLAESGGRPDARNPRSSATGAGQFIAGTWLEVVRRHAPDVAADKTDAEVLALRSDPALSRRMVAAYAGDNRAALEARGLPADDGALYLAHFAGPAGAAAVLEAVPDTPVSDLLSAEATAANPHLRDQTAGQLRDWAARKVGAAPGLTGDPLLLAGARRALADKAKDRWSEIESGLNDGIRPTAEDLSAVISAAARAGDADLLEDIADRVDRAGIMADLERLPLAEAERTRQALEQEAVTSGLSPGRAALLADMRELVNATRAGLAKDPLGLAADRGLVAPLPDVDWSNPDQAAGALRVRQTTARMVEQHYGTGTVPVFRPDELGRLKAQWDGGDSAARTQLLGTLAGSLDGDHLAATLAEVAPDRPTFAWAGALYQRSPQVALSVVRGESIMAADKKVVPSDDNYRRTVVGDFFGTAMAGTPQARAAAEQAALARYADLAAAEGDFSGELDPRRLERALADVTGGVVEWNDRKVIAPRPGMTEDQFEDLLDGLTDADLDGMRTFSGTAVTAATFRRLAKLHDAGAGRYLVQIGGGFAQGADGQPFVLDLGAKVR